MSVEPPAVVDAFRAAIGADGIAVEFGRVAGEARNATNIALSDRVVMSQETALRLAVALNDCLTRAPAGGAQRLAGSATGASRGEIPVHAPADPAGEKAALLMRLVAGLRIPFQHERSFRLSDQELLANRFLLTVNREDIGAEPLDRVLGICRQLAMPRSLEPQIEASFDASRCIHFGFEGAGGSTLCKLYLERAFTAADVDRARRDRIPFPLHLAFKWDMFEAKHVVSRYLWHPGLTLTEIEARLAAIYQPGDLSVSFDIAKAVLSLAASKAPVERLLYLEVLEDENDRRSFDLNLYEAGLGVRDIQHLLSRMRVHYGIRPGQFQALFDQIRTKSLGHVAGGVHRNGRDFFNVYYGAEGLPHFSQSLS